MSTPLTTDDVKRMEDREALTTMTDADTFIIHDTSELKIKKITKVNAKEDLGINDKADKDADAVEGNFASFDSDGNPVDSGIAPSDKEDADETILKQADIVDALDSTSTTAPLSANQGKVLKDAQDALKGPGWTDENLVDHETRIASTESSLLTTKLAVNELERQSQIGNGATLDFSDIGIVPLDARATGRANPTIEGLTARNLVENGDFSDGLTGFSTVGCTLSGETVLFDTSSSVYLRSDISIASGDVWAIIIKLKRNATAEQLTVNLLDTSNVSVSNTVLISPTETYGVYIAYLTATGDGTKFGLGRNTAGDTCTIDYAMAINLTQTFGAGNEPTEADCAKIFSYFDGTKSIQLPARVRSVSEDESETSTLYIADDDEPRSIQDVKDTISVINGVFTLTKKVSTPVAVASGVSVDTTNYPTAKTGGKWANELTAGGTEIGVIGTDSTTGAGTLRYELATPVVSELLASGNLKAFQNGSVYYEPYYEGSHQTNASSQITLPYEGTIDKVYGYDENYDEYEVTDYSLTGTTLTITGAVENEVFYVQMSRSEPLAPSMSVNVLNDNEVTLDSADGKYYQIGFTTTNGVPTVTATEVV